MTTVLTIGDPHFKLDNIPEVEMFIDRMENLVKEKEPDIIVCLGDLLHTHERLHTIALNKAYEFIEKMSQLCKIYVIVGNHDYISNREFLTNNHWMNGMKKWNNVTIVDKVIKQTVNEEEFIFLPYVPPGRFIEALDTIDGADWNNASCIFAHQEFAGCKMGAITSIEGDNWLESYPKVVSGHIHSRQIPQSNIYYPGSAMQHAFGESEKNIIAYLTFNNKRYEKEEVDLLLPRKKIIYMNVEDIDEYNIEEDIEDKIKLSVTGNYEQFKALKKTKKYKDIIDKGVKISFKQKKLEREEREEGGEEGEEKKEVDGVEFKRVLEEMINKKKDEYLLQAFEYVINGRALNVEDVFFL